MAKTLLVLALLVVCVPGASAQTVAPQPPPAANQIDAQDMYELVLKDGSRIYGTVQSETDQEVVFKSNSGAIVTAKRSDIVSLRRVKGRIEQGQFLRTDMHRSRLFFAPTGRSLDKGQVSVGVFQFFAPFVQIGVTDRFSVGGGTPLVFGIDEFERPFWVTPKMQVYRTEKAQAAVGVLHVFAADNDSAGIAYGVSTFGNADNAVTVGAGMAYAGDEKGALFMIGGETRATRNLKLISENYITKSGNGIISGGIRFLGERLSADLALAIPIGVGDIFAFPVINFVYVFK